MTYLGYVTSFNIVLIYREFPGGETSKLVKMDPEEDCFGFPVFPFGHFWRNSPKISTTGIFPKNRLRIFFPFMVP